MHGQQNIKQTVIWVYMCRYDLQNTHEHTTQFTNAVFFFTFGTIH